MTLREIASNIQAEMESAQKTDESQTRTYFNAGACVAGRYVKVWYVSYQWKYNLSKHEAEIYVKWLYEGNRGTHRDALAVARQTQEVNA